MSISLTHKSFTVVPPIVSTNGETKWSPAAILCNHGDPVEKCKGNMRDAIPVFYLANHNRDKQSQACIDHFV